MDEYEENKIDNVQKAQRKQIILLGHTITQLLAHRLKNVWSEYILLQNNAEESARFKKREYYIITHYILLTMTNVNPLYWMSTKNPYTNL